MWMKLREACAWIEELTARKGYMFHELDMENSPSKMRIPKIAKCADYTFVLSHWSDLLTSYSFVNLIFSEQIGAIFRLIYCCAACSQDMIATRTSHADISEKYFTLYAALTSQIIITWRWVISPSFVQLTDISTILFQSSGFPYSVLLFPPCLNLQIRILWSLV